MGLFRSKNDYVSNTLHYITDSDRLVLIDSAYKDMGLAEGWLLRTGYYRDEKNRLCFTYKHIRRTI